MRGIFLCGNIIRSVCVIIGTIIGAGFASGKEIEVFFTCFGKLGICGIALASVFTSCIIYFVLKSVKKAQINNYNFYLQSLNINKNIIDILNAAINIFLLGSFYIMTTGFCAYFKQEFNINEFYVATGLMIGCYITFLGKIEKITKINTILIPFLIIMILFIGIKNNILDQSIKNIVQISNKNWFISCLEYASYNSILLIPILIELKKYTNKKEKAIAIISGVIFFILASVLFLIITKENLYMKYELPLIQIVKKYGNIYRYIYGFVIVSAIFTSVISAGYSFLENCTKTKKTYKWLNILICIGILFVCKLKFSYLINMVYPIFGILGLIQVIYIILIKTIEKKGKN